MTKKEWTREMYQQLEELLERKASPGEIATKFKIAKKDIAYRVKILKQQTSIHTIPEKELELLEESKTIEVFMTGWREIHGKHKDGNMGIRHWVEREKLIAAWQKEKAERQKVHMVAIHQMKRTDPISPQRETLVMGDQDICEKLTVLIDRVTELVQIQKDAYALFKKLSDGGKKS